MTKIIDAINTAMKVFRRETETEPVSIRFSSLLFNNMNEDDANDLRRASNMVINNEIGHILDEENEFFELCNSRHSLKFSR